MALTDYAGAYGRPTSIKAILKDNKGFTQERVVKFPPPPYISMAETSGVFPKWIEDGETLPPEPIIKHVRFRYVSLTSIPDPYEKGSIYTANYVEDGSVDVNSIEAMVANHRSTYKYNQNTEDLMVQIGMKVKANKDENPVQYLDRLLLLARQEEAKMTSDPWWLQNQTYLDSTTGPNLGQINQISQQQAQQAIQTAYYQKQYGYYQPAYATSAPSWTSTLETYPSPLIQAQPTIEPPPPEKPKAELPEPVEPQKRFMKKE